MPSLHSGISASAPVESLGLRRILRYYHSRSPCSTTFHSGAISPRSRPTESGSARAYLRLRFARYRLVTWLRFGGFLIHSFSGRGEVGRKTGKRKDGREIGRLASSRPLTGSYSTGQEVILISVIFLCRSVHSCIQFPLSVERLPL